MEETKISSSEYTNHTKGSILVNPQMKGVIRYYGKYNTDYTKYFGSTE